LLLNGDTHSRRDYVFVYAGPKLGATVKGNYKRHWMSPEVQALANPKLDRSKLPFDPLQYVEHLDELPFDPAMDPDVGQ
jgi:hypothetical protein